MLASIWNSGSRMCIPLVSFGQTLGVLVLDGAQTEFFSANDVQSLESVADICANAIQNAHYVERVQAPGLSRRPDRNFQPPLLRTADYGGN